MPSRNPPKARLFVYGTLMRGGAQNGLVADLPDARRIGRGWVAGRLLDFGAHPGAVLDPRASSRIEGELWEARYRPGMFRALDAYEEFLPHAPERSFFLRTRARVHLARETREAWIYVPRRPPSSARVIPGGVWVL